MKVLLPCLGALLLSPGTLAAVQFSARKFNIHTGETHHVVTFPAYNKTSKSLTIVEKADKDHDHERGRLGRRSGISYSGNWCGAAQNPPSGTFTNAFGIWNVVDVSLRSGQTNSETPFVSQWVGIDGTGCGSGLIQAGTFSGINSDGSVSASAWWEFLPGPAYNINLPVSIGDQVGANITVTGSTSGTMGVLNFSTGYGIEVIVTGGGGTLCGSSAEWILEDASVNGGLATFPDFTAATYYDSYATTSSGASVGFDGSTDIYLVLNGSVACQGGENSNGDLSVTDN